MIRRILQTKHEKVTTPLMSFGCSKRSSYQSIQEESNSFKNQSLQPKNSQPQSQKITSRDIFENKQTCVSKKIIPSKQNMTQILQQKSQNVSCLYSDFMYKSKNVHFLQGIKIERYKNILQKETEEKISLARKVQSLKYHIQKIMTQKQTVMFAYRALQTKIRQINLDRQRKSHLKQGSKSSIIGFQKSAEQYIEMIEEQLTKSRKGLVSQGILQPANQLVSITNFSNNKFQISMKRISQQSKKLGLGYMRHSNQRSDPIFQQFNESTNNQQKLRMQNQIQNLKQNNLKLSEQLNSLTYSISNLESQLQQTSKQLVLERQIHQKSKNQFCQTNQLYLNLKQKYEQNMKQVQRKLQIIKQLQQTKYQYLMKEEKEKQQIELLKKFTENLEINDQKIKEFIKVQFNTEFGNNVVTEKGLFKEDLSYILHLTKKKQNVYSQFLNQNLQKLKQSQTRCFMLQKKQHISEIFCQSLKILVKLGQSSFNYAKFVEMFQRYLIDKRLI